MSNTVTIVVSRDQPVTSVRLRGPQNFRYVRSDEVLVELVGPSEEACRRLAVAIRNGELTAETIPRTDEESTASAGKRTEIRVGNVTITGGNRMVAGMRVAGTITRNGIEMYVSPEGPHEIVLYQPECPSLHLSGAGDAVLDDVAQPTLSVDLRGAGNLTGAGRVAELSLSMSGAGNADLSLLSSHRAHVVATGAGDVVVKAWDTITGRMTGIGSLLVLGDPQVREITHTGIGQVAFRQGELPAPVADEKNSTCHADETPAAVATRLVRELEDGTAELDLRAWAREAAPILSAARSALPLLAQITETLDVGAKIHPESEVHHQMKSLFKKSQ